MAGKTKQGKVLIGISSWTEPTLIKEGNFYPKGVSSAEERLKFYASQFPIVEVDSTYYFPPSERNSVLWIERTPKDFTFNIKAYALLTNHPTKVESLYKDVREALPEEVAAKKNVYREHLPEKLADEVWDRFRESLMPLHSAGKLGSVLFQYPQWFVIGRKNKDYIIKKLNAAIAEAARDEQVRELAPKLGFELDPKGVGAPEDAAEFLKTQLALWAKTTQELGIEPQ